MNLSVGAVPRSGDAGSKNVCVLHLERKARLSYKEVLGVHIPLTSVVRVSVLTSLRWLPSSLCLSNRTNGTRCFNLCFVSCE